MLVNSISLRLILVCCMIIGIGGKSSELSNHIPTHPYVGDTTICRTTPGLTKSQLELCYKQPDVTSIAVQGIHFAVKECQFQFQSNRWNCSSLNTKARNPYTSAIFQQGFRETAFGYAISSAAVVISVARACSNGKLLSCGCDSNRNRVKGMKEMPDDWKWGGCSHNLQYGLKYSKMFLDRREKAVDIHSKINLHNNQVGRLTVSNNMQVKCKCHGMSGSCELKTCWRTTPDMRQIGRLLKDRYRAAVLVDQSNLGNENPKKFNVLHQSKRRREKSRTRLKQWIPHQSKHKKNLQYDLLYYQKSPNFCDKDSSLDIPGTFGRLCNRTSVAQDSCSSLCCGRGYNLVMRKRIDNCNCKFLWCCKVECQSCVIEEWITVCN